MLPPRSSPALRRHTCSSLPSPTLLFRKSSALTITTASTRSFWSWRRGSDRTSNYTSHLDPLFQRFTRHRTLKTRADLLEKLKRRGKFDWDASQKAAYFTPKNIRWASHWNGGRSGSPPWEFACDKSGRKVPKPLDGEAERGVGKETEGYQLSAREKAWKERMENMRDIINRDPYEAVFGKKFEPFWGPLVPAWMREEMGLQDPKKKEDADDQPAEKTSKSTSAAPPVSSQPKSTHKTSPPLSEAKVSKVQSTRKSVESTPKTMQGLPSKTYSSYSATSWDSQSNTAKRSEWDSTTRQLKRFEYDAVSGRMVQVDHPVLVESAKSKQDMTEPKTIVTAESKHAAKLDSSDAPPAAANTSLPVMNRSRDMRSLINTPLPPTKAAQTPVETWAPVVAPRTKGNHEAHPSRAPRPAALAHLPKDDVDFLTTDSVRARMGKIKLVQMPKSSTGLAALQAELEHAFDKNATAADTETDAILLERERGKSRLSNTREHSRPEQQTERLQTSLDRARKPTTTVLQSAVERMQSKDLIELDDSAAHESTEVIERSSTVPQAWAQQAEILQSDRIKRVTGSKPQARRWLDDMNAARTAYEASQQAIAIPERSEQTAKLEKANAMLETEVQEQKSRMQAHEGRYARKIRELRGELEVAYRQSAVQGGEHVERIRFLEAQVGKADGGAEKTAVSAVVIDQPVGGEGDFCANVAKFAGADRWYKQPSFHAQIPLPETAASKLTTEQAAQKASDQALVKSVRDIYEKAYGTIEIGHRQPAAIAVTSETASTEPQQDPKKITVKGEGSAQLGDALAEHEKKFSYAFQKSGHEGFEKEMKTKACGDALTGNVTGKKSATPDPEQGSSSGGVVGALEKRRDPALDRALAEHETIGGYKSIGKNVDEVTVEKKCGVAAALGKFEQGRGRAGYAFRADESEVLEKELVAKAEALRLAQLAARKNAAHEAQGWIGPATAKDFPVERTASRLEETVLLNPSVQWVDPPLYKVLAYDSGNDRLTTATTTSNFMGSPEVPISIPQALSQLYQPARFVPHFAELQEDGYQVIFGTRDLLVFKKVVNKTHEPAAVMAPEVSALADHGILKPKENEVAQEAANYYDFYHKKPVGKSYDPTNAINPIDGTTKPDEAKVLTGNFASPTGFVNYESFSPPREESERNGEAPRDLASVGVEGNAQDSAKSTAPPRVIRREEVVFSGTRRKWNDRAERHQQRHHRQQESSQRKSSDKRRGSGAVKWALSVGLGAAALTYGIGVAAEASRQERVEKERWRQVLEGRRARWE